MQGAPARALRAAFAADLSRSLPQLKPTPSPIPGWRRWTAAITPSIDWSVALAIHPQFDEFGISVRWKRAGDPEPRWGPAVSTTGPAATLRAEGGPGDWVAAPILWLDDPPRATQEGAVTLETGYSLYPRAEWERRTLAGDW